MLQCIILLYILGGVCTIMQWYLCCTLNWPWRCCPWRVRWLWVPCWWTADPCSGDPVCTGNWDHATTNSQNINTELPQVKYSYQHLVAWLFLKPQEMFNQRSIRPCHVRAHVALSTLNLKAARHIYSILISTTSCELSLLKFAHVWHWEISK